MRCLYGVDGCVLIDVGFGADAVSFVVSVESCIYCMRIVDLEIWSLKKSAQDIIYD